MAEQIPVSQKFQADPRGWTMGMIARLMQPGVVLKAHTRTYVVRMRARLAEDEALKPGPNTYERLCRIARASGVLARRRRIPRVDERPASAPALPVPDRFRVGAPIPEPPLLRRPVVMLDGSVVHLPEPTETWDPAGMPCR
jgi:hypothetical protein